jgi:hypothetical protein
MTAPQEHPLDGLLEEMLPVAAEVTVAVRDRDPHAVAAALWPLLDAGQHRRICALIVDLAALVPDDKPMGDLLAWTHGPVVDDATYAKIVAFNPQPGLRECRDCHEWLPLKSFTKDRTRKGGYRPQCRSCLSETRTARRVAGSDTEAEAS